MHGCALFYQFHPLLVKLLTAGQYISIISYSMQSLTESRQQWKDLKVECKNIDQVLELPDSEPLSRTADGSIRLQGASFGWPTKPPAQYTVKANGTPCKAVTDGGVQRDAVNVGARLVRHPRRAVGGAGPRRRNRVGRREGRAPVGVGERLGREARS